MAPSPSSTTTTTTTCCILFICLISFHFQPCSSLDERRPLPLLANPIDGASLIDKICQQVSDYSLCFRVLSDHSLSPTNAIDLTQIAITQATINATNNRIMISKWIQVESDVTVKDLLNICQAGYGVVVDQFVQIHREFIQKYYRIMVADIQKSVRPVSDCQNLFPQPSGNEASLGFRNKQMLVLINMARVAGSLLQ